VRLAEVLAMGSKIESIGLYKDPNTSGISTIDLANKAVIDCLNHSRHDKKEIDYILHISNHRNYRAKEIVEPSMACFFQRDVQINHDTAYGHGRKTLSFDLMNGSLGFLQAAQMIDALFTSQRAKVGLVVSGNSKIPIAPLIKPRIPFYEIGCSVLLDESTDQRGFSAFSYRSFPEYIDDYESYLFFKSGEWCYRWVQSQNILEIFINVIQNGVIEYLQRSAVSLSSFDLVIAPQISPAFIGEVCDALGGEKARFVDATINGDDLFSASIPLALKHAMDHRLAQPGKKALLISVGSGIQVGCATYVF
jgi:3-oxoacyl-[acyl-carrier-protein] synthase III